MALEGKSIDSIQFGDIEQLVVNQVEESITLDYKEQMPSSKKDFLADVVAMLNTEGGWLVFGVREARDEQGRSAGVPQDIVGIETENWDTEKQRLESWIRDHIHPRPLGVRVRLLQEEGSNERKVAIVHVPRSVLAPHAFKIERGYRFYRRGDGGNYPMAIEEIRQAFLLSESWLERAEAFRRNRVALIDSEDSPIRMSGDAKMFVHLVPLGWRRHALPVGENLLYEKARNLGTLSGGVWFRHNFDGLLLYRKANHEIDSYVQIFRNGRIEACDSGMLEKVKEHKEKYGVYLIPSLLLEENLLKFLQRALTFLQEFEVQLPVALFLTLTHVRNYAIPYREHFFVGYVPIDRDKLFFFPQIIKDFDVPADVLLRPILDALWNASGYPRDFFYDEDGRWRGRKRV